MEKRYEIRRAALKKLTEDLGRGGIARVAKEIGAEPNYVSRMLYPPGKAGRKNIGEEIAEKIGAAFPKWLNEIAPVTEPKQAQKHLVAEQPQSPYLAVVSIADERRKAATNDPNETMLLDAYRKASPDIKRIMIANARETLALFGKRSEERN